MISFELQDEEQMLQETARAFAEGEVRPALRECERSPEALARLRERFGALGLGAIDLPADLGGAGLGAVGVAVAAEEIARGDPGIAAALFASYPAACVLREIASDGQRRRWLAPLADRGARLALAASEVDAPAEGFATTARRSGDAWVLSGRKSFVAHGGAADLHLVLAQVDGEGWDGIGIFAVETGTPGLKRGALHETLGLSAVPFAEVALEDCRVPADCRIGGGDDRLGLHRALLRAALLPAALAVGCARASYEYALRYAEERHAFGKPIGHFQGIAFMLAEIAMDVDAARWMLWRAAAALDRGESDRHAVAMAVTQAHETATRVTEQGVQILGGHGYMRDHPQEKWMRDAKTLALYVAPAEYADALAASAVLGEAEPPAPESLPFSGLQPPLF